MPTILEALRGRIQQRQLNALDTVAAGAKAAARGERYDVLSIEKALLEAGMTMADFEKAVERAGERATWLSDFEQLANASAKAKKLEASLEAERSRFEATRAAYFEKAQALESQLREVQAIRDRARAAHDRLLDPREVPGMAGEKYRRAVAEAEAANAELGQAERAVREQQEKIKSEQGWIQQLLGEDAKEINPSRISLRDENPRESPRLEEHRLALTRAERRKAEAEKVLAEAEKRAALARKAVDALVAEVLQA
jgi:chromosome segregation ATPase